MARNDRSPEDKQDALFGRLRALRSHAQSLQGIAARLVARAQELADPETRDRELPALLAEDRGTVELNLRLGRENLDEILALLTGWEKLYAGWGDIVTQIQIDWDRAAGEWLKVFAAEPKDWDRPLARAATALDEVVFHCAKITVPDRLTGHLRLLPIGGRLDLAAAYSDEIPTPEGRRRFLEYMSYYPGYVKGLIDVEAGCIYRAAERPWLRARTLVLTVVLALCGFPILALATLLGEGLQLSDWPFTWSRLAGHYQGYFFLLLGALAHVLVDLLKQDRSASQSTQVLSEWILRIHVKESSFLLSAVSFWVGGLAFAFLGAVDWKMAFFVGYSYDSFIDLFLQRFDTTVAAATKSITSTLAVPAAQAPTPAPKKG